MSDQGGNTVVMRDYRKGNWTLSETMVLIEAKRMDDERRMKRSSDTEGRNTPTELRWKWVEDYCWRKGCLRSQNQCNDKWDNLMRDYKKVRDYERRIAERGDGSEGSYWKLEKSEKKEKNLPSNMLLQIYEALVEVVEKRSSGGPRMATDHMSSCSNPNISYVVERPIASVQAPMPPVLQRQVPGPVIPALALPMPPPLPQAEPPPHHLQFSVPLPTVDSDTSEYSDSPAKRRRRSGGGGGEGTSTGGTATASTAHEVGTAISKSASIIADAIQACEERQEKRHRDLLSLHERRLQIEESKTEINRQGINGLVDAINKLANSILALASHKNPPASSK